MIIHFSVLILILLVSFFYEHKFRAEKIRVISSGGLATDYLGSIVPWLIVFGYLAFLAGMRTYINDTIGYLNSFVSLEPSWAGIWDVISGSDKDKGFSILMHLFKMYISKDYHAWFFFFSAIESIVFIYILRRESVSFLDTCYFIFVSALYYNYFSMMRQWFAVVSVFFASKFIKSRKFIPYLLICLFAAQFHNSAYFLIPLYFIVNIKAWSKMLYVMLGAFVVALIFLEPLLGAVGEVTGDTTYNYVVDTMREGSGSSWVRVPIAAVPIILSYVYRDTIKENKMINICVNFSLINLLLNIVAVFTSGLFIIRMSTYMNIYNAILYPYLLNISVDQKNRNIIKTLFYIIYFAYYVYQMLYQGAFFYGSDVLGNFY
ncbi:MAG: EpsG family protein [Ruminococcus sp.]|nr:EpsG family protein [Ruminococcus sp.]